MKTLILIACLCLLAACTTLPKNDCPQLRTPMSENAVPLSGSEDLGGWQLVGKPMFANMDYVTVNHLPCRKGLLEGENTNHYYCTITSGGIVTHYLTRTPIAADGTIGRAERRTFYNVYDAQGAHIKSVCGPLERE